ncbi:T9SS type B sorting domain-containing protein [Bizionia paragorgiae]|uniref:T9SS type B sorting domain-containing protein n=1 Tax=Bizionia paragorgiae TaxID=283786 RepID=UPI00299D66BA|nr:T9SS type B sorting domain-containing protein [Bizionia paragorgiae]MDX1271216.1 T9SS type B sorting domain-containing protein [Bizionia paragorgiae]
MKKTLLLLFLLCFVFTYGQNEASNWYFGDNAGINFDINTGNITALTDGQLATVEGCTTISDTNGNLVLYTDGTTVYNANHNTITNGSGLLGDASSSQSAIIVPKPNAPDIYYIFTVGSNQNPTGLNYSIVDMTAVNGNGAVTVKNESLLPACSEKISAVLKDCSSGNIWVIAFSNSNGTSTNNMDTFHAYEVSNTGVNTTAVTSSVNTSIDDARGNLKFSPDGSRLACANVQDGLFIADFDKQTGLVSNRQYLQINTQNSNKPYGVEFSPNSELLYVTASNDFFQSPSENNNPNNHKSSLIQYNLVANNISGSQIIIDERSLYRGGLQLGPDGKVYRALSSTYDVGLAFLGAIDAPNTVGIGCNYIHNAVDLNNRNARQGLPPFITSFFSEKIDIIQNNVNTTNLPLCVGDSYTLTADNIPGATYSWTKDGNPIPPTNPAIPYELEVTDNGSYEVFIDLNNGNCNSLEGIAIVTYFDIPTANQPNSVSLCDIDNDNSEIFDLTQLNPEILLTQNATEFNVKYYSSQADADNNLNEIIGAYTVSSASESLVARVESSGNSNCYQTTPVTLTLSSMPTLLPLDDFNSCDIDMNPSDGFSETDLSSFNAAILNGQDPTVFSVTYHSSQNDANDNLNALPMTYTNQTAFTETLFVRVENVNNRQCYVTDSFDLNINPIPEVTASTLYQCDEDGINDGFTTFNLTEANVALLNNQTENISVSFYLTSADAQSNLNPVNALAYNNITNPQELYVKATHTETGCENFTTLTIEVSTTQISNYIADPVCDTIGSEDGIHTFDLSTFTSDILNGLPQNLTINYYENYDDALLETNPIIETGSTNFSYTNTVPYSQTIYVRVENDNACYGISDVLLTINPLPELSNDASLFYCLNDFPETITLNGGVINANPHHFLYDWSTGETTQNIEINTTGTYTVTVTNPNTNCSKTRTISVEPSNIATINAIDITDGFIRDNTITILASGEGDYHYALVNEDGESTPFQESNTFTHIPPGIYSVVVKDIKNNCGIVDQTISVVGFPLYFTPNGDGINDTWQVYGVNSKFQSASDIKIFDRYGKHITTINTSSRGWDGTYNGNPMPTNDYWFYVTLEDGRIYKSHFTLKR